MKYQIIYNVLKNKVLQIILSILCVFLAFFIQNHDIPYLGVPLNALNGLIYDGFIKINPHKKPQRVKVVVINVDDKSIQEQGNWPWPRNKMALLLENLKKTGTAVIALNMVMSSSEGNDAIKLKDKLSHMLGLNPATTENIIAELNEIAPQFDNDTIFFNELKQNKVVQGYLFQDDPRVRLGVLAPPLLNEKLEVINSSDLLVQRFKGYYGTLKSFLDASPYSGSIVLSTDGDGILRYGSLVAGFNNRLYASLAMVTVMRYLMVNKIELLVHPYLGFNIIDGVNIGGIFIPTNKSGSILIPFFGPAETIDYYSATDVMEGRLSKTALAGAIAVVGSNMPMIANLYTSPISDAFPDVEIQANMISGILSQQIYSHFHWYTLQGLISLALLGTFFAVLFAFLGPISLIIVYMLFVGAVWLIGLYVFIYHQSYINMTSILFIITLQAIIHFVASFMLERRQKNKINHLFGQYVPPDYVKQLTESPALYSVEGEERDMTVFFSDIRNFTTLSEFLDAANVKSLLNAVFTPMTEIIFEHQGTIDKYVGDMVVAFWGAPMHDAQHALHGIETALGIQKYLQQINAQLVEKNLPTVKIGMGLSSGLMNVGDMGSAFRLAYTVIGDTVNIGSRLQDLTKLYQVDILVGEPTRLGQDLFIWQFIDRVILHGRLEFLNIYEPLGYYQAASPLLHDELDAYEQALAPYFQQDWTKAKIAFEQLIQRYPSRYLYQFYSKRVTELMSQPKCLNWDISYIHAHKPMA